MQQQRKYSNTYIQINEIKEVKIIGKKIHSILRENHTYTYGQNNKYTLYYTIYMHLYKYGHYNKNNI